MSPFNCYYCCYYKWARRKRRTRRSSKRRKCSSRSLLLFWTILLSFPIKNVLSGAIRQRHQEEEEKEKEEDVIKNENHHDHHHHHHQLFLDWVEDELNINTELVTVQNFEYFDYNAAMKDRVDIFYDEENQYYQRSNNDNNNNNNFYSYDAFFQENEEIMNGVEEEGEGGGGGKNKSSKVKTELEDDVDDDNDVYHNYDGDDNHNHNNKVSYGPYLRLLQQGTNLHEQIPHLWDARTLRRSATIGVRKVSKGIQRDVNDLYQSILIPLIKDYPDIFGNPFYSRQRPPKEMDENELEWMYSLEKFHWAFAVVNSRHWHLPIPDVLDEKDDSGEDGQNESSSSSSSSSSPASSSVQLFDDNNASPPASMPTDEWMDVQQEIEHRRDEESTTVIKSTTKTVTAATAGGGDDDDWAIGNSFLAPVADLLNFGPPCTRGVYNTTTNTFDILATCNIAKGQEITFWYADACQGRF